MNRPIAEHHDMRLNALQIEAILDRLVPLLAAPENQGFFRGVIGLKLENSTSGDAALFINNLLTQGSTKP
jgi:hypothetical protein